MFNFDKSPAVLLNEGQQAAADFFFEFLFDDTKKMMIISGGGGMGKSYLTGYLIDRIIPNYEKTCGIMGITPKYTEVHTTATTNKAAAVTSEATGRPAMTIQSFLGLTVKTDFGTGRTHLVRTNKWKVHQRMIIFVDECSMVDSDLLAFIDEGTLDCKVVFVGDHCQLGPVNEGVSPIYRLGLPFYNLTEPVRNAGQPALIKLCQQMRNTVETGEFHPIQLVPGVIDLVDADEIQARIDQSFRAQAGASRILAYTNQRVTDYNTHIRDIRGLQEEFTVGETLVNNNAFVFHKQRLRIEEEITILEQSETTEMLDIHTPSEGEVVRLEVRRTDIKTSLGDVLSRVPVPVDREHHNALIKYFGRMKMWHRWGYLKENIPDLRPRDAATVHKAQGSTYDTVFVDLDNLSTCHQPNTAARLLNVAFSRARNNIVLYGELAYKYGGVTA